MISALAAAKAYAATQGSATPALGGSAAPAAGPSFGDMVKSSISEMMETSKTAEKQIVAQVQGKAELVDVVTALSAAETSMETVMAVRDQVIAVAEAVLEQVRPPFAAVLQEGEAVARVGVLAQDDHADLGVRLAQPGRERDPLVVPARRHPDVGDHDVGLLGLDHSLELRPVLAGRHEVDARVGVEQGAERLTHQIAVVGDDHAKPVSHDRGLSAFPRRESSRCR